jgi:hypothetical protein
MITFNVVREKHGWAIRLDKCMTTPFRLRELAIREAQCLAEAIRRHGESAQVVVEEDEDAASATVGGANNATSYREQ